MYAQADDEFPFIPGASATLTAFDGSDDSRPTYLFTERVEAVRAVYSALSLPRVRADRSLQTAMRRLVFSGSRVVDADRLIDLMISAEALFVKRPGLSGHSKGDKIATAAAGLAGDPEIKADASQIHLFMTKMYQMRNNEIHGDDDPYSELHLLNGTPTASLPGVLDDVETIMRRAILKFVDEDAARNESTREAT